MKKHLEAFFLISDYRNPYSKRLYERGKRIIVYFKIRGGIHMIYKTSNFYPTDYHNIDAFYNDETKELSFNYSEGFFYPSDSESLRQLGVVEEWMKEHKTTCDSLEEANLYLLSIGVSEVFLKKEND